MLALGQPPAQPGTQADPRAQLLGPIGMFVIMGVIFYLLLFRPQQKKAKEHAQLLKSVKRGDEVVTSGGILGEVITVKEKTLIVRSMDAKLEINKSAVAEITRRSGEAAQS